jgi:hypothetical protein
MGSSTDTFKHTEGGGLIFNLPKERLYRHTAQLQPSTVRYDILSYHKAPHRYYIADLPRYRTYREVQRTISNLKVTARSN